jgi:hypothetical protein
MRKNKKVLNIIAALLVVLVLLCMMTRSEGFIIINSKLINPKHAAWEAGQAIRDAEWAKERAAGQKIIDAKHAALEKESIANRLAIKAKDAQLERENQERIALHKAALAYARSVIKGKPHRWSKAEDQEEVKAYHDYIAQHSKS